MGIKTEFVPLEVGDYVVCGPSMDVCAELKSVPDYLLSIQNNRLNQELLNMSTAYKKSLLIVHGYIEEGLVQRKIKRSTYYHYLAGCIIHESDEGFHGSISVVNVSTVYDAACLLKTIHEKVYKDDIIRRPDAKRYKVKEGDQKLFTIQSLPNVGSIRGEKLKEKFRTIRNLVNASEKELLEVEGIGNKISDFLYKYFNEE
jgi:Fanconi anemia group M protein